MERGGTSRRSAEVAALDSRKRKDYDEIRPDLQLIRRGRKVLVPVAELERWVSENIERPLVDELSSGEARP